MVEKEERREMKNIGLGVSFENETNLEPSQHELVNEIRLEDRKSYFKSEYFKFLSYNLQ